MKISELSIQELYIFVNGDNQISTYREGKDLVYLFNKYGNYREIYDDNEGLPFIGKKMAKDHHVKNLQYTT